ncbi:heavy metal translocating P-type ATPase [Corynebacterium doosanense]|uniref:Metal ABC transporter ATPase n=1 Tax=Corynebacterium doosanense CAU 212 = DSM 45436 TaxID=558173 RepID=A0A097IDM2_9CORY|nr:HAD family hydrolase [Corynebacterium doosanense]AIT60231.1 metal ABC transporter ATPase [Corynebacterium doosanense CAU 212 = DSM 45436]
MSTDDLRVSDDVTCAIDDARNAARAAGLFSGDDTDRELDSSRNISYAFELTGLRSAADLGEIEAALGRLPGVRARIVYPSATAYLTAPETVSLEKLVAVLAEFGVDAVLTDSSLRRRLLTPSQLHGPDSRLSDPARLRKMPGSTRRHLAEEARELQRARAAGFLDHSSKYGDPDTHSDGDVLYTAKELVSPTRFLVALVLSVPVVAMMYSQALQFDGWQWWSLGLATPVVTWCALPFHRALVGGIRRGISALDGASAVAIIVAYLWSLIVLAFTGVGELGWHSSPTWFAFDHGGISEGELFLDVACVMTVVLLAGRLVTMRSHASLLKQMEARRPSPTQPALVAKPHHRSGSSRPEKLTLGEVNVGDDVVVGAGQIIPVDGAIIGGSCHVSPGLVDTEFEEGREVKVGSYVYAGTKNRDGRIKVRVERTGHATRMAAVHRWVEVANWRQNQATMLSTKFASVLIPAAVAIAVTDFLLWYLVTGNINSAVATALAVLASVAPVALALSPALAIRHGIEAAARSGVMVRDGSTLRRLNEVDTAIFNRLGTLSSNEMRVENVVAARGEHSELVLRVAAALAMESGHPASQALVKAARASRDRDDEASTSANVPHWIDVSRVELTPGGAFTGLVELPIADSDGTYVPRQVEAMLWRPRTMSDLTGTLAAAAVSGGTPFVVRWQGVDRGVITLLDSTRPDAEKGIELLEEQGVETIMLSRDTYPVARRFADRLGIDNVLAGITRDAKVRAVRGVHTQGKTVAMIGDLTVVEAMRAADVGILMGETEALDLNKEVGHEGVDVVVLPDTVTSVARLLAHSRRICRIIDRNMVLSWTYNILAIGAAVAGVLNPMAATLLMIGSSWIIEKHSNSARTFPRLA